MEDWSKEKVAAFYASGASFLDDSDDTEEAQEEEQAAHKHGKTFLAMSKYIHFRHSSGVRWTVCSACSPQGCDDTCSHQIVGHVTPSVESCCSILQHVVASIIIIYRSASHILVAHLVNSIQFNFSTANAANAFLRWKEPSPGVRGQRLLRFFARVR